MGVIISRQTNSRDVFMWRTNGKGDAVLGLHESIGIYSIDRSLWKMGGVWVMTHTPPYYTLLGCIDTMDQAKVDM